jgi:hypothetical protein
MRLGCPSDRHNLAQRRPAVVDMMSVETLGEIQMEKMTNCCAEAIVLDIIAVWSKRVNTGVRIPAGAMLTLSHFMTSYYPSDPIQTAPSLRNVWSKRFTRSLGGVQGADHTETNC